MASKFIKKWFIKSVVLPESGEFYRVVGITVKVVYAKDLCCEKNKCRDFNRSSRIQHSRIRNSDF